MGGEGHAAGGVPDRSVEGQRTPTWEALPAAISVYHCAPALRAAGRSSHAPHFGTGDAVCQETVEDAPKAFWDEEEYVPVRQQEARLDDHQRLRPATVDA